MSFLISDAYAAAVPAQNGGGMGSILMLVGFVLIFYLLLWLPQSKRAKEHRNLINGLTKDDEVITGGGILGKINKVGDDFVTMQIADNVEVKVQKSSIAATVPKGTYKSI